MRKTALFIAGIAVGVYLAKQIESNPAAKQALDQAGTKVKTFANALSDGYRQQEAKHATATKSKK